jgi:hypothetical protein
MGRKKGKTQVSSLVPGLFDNTITQQGGNLLQGSPLSQWRELQSNMESFPSGIGRSGGEGETERLAIAKTFARKWQMSSNY